ncbi:Gonadotropin-releasing hormone II receptor [Orchesella cincta]|uniref:Gonadotropin-releasing hormone II receptor n=1 Tax=Orchesella cincta TaxID=48709 RepID=A0A1D2M9E0_ORCCI|nr:Gonadotropin-releasing hormone II receptor [Orchesella cincta]
MAHNTPLQSPTDLPSDTLHEIDSLYEEVTVTAIPFSYTSYSPPEQSSTPGELPIDMRFNDGHRIAIILYTLLMTVSAVGNMYVFGSIVSGFNITIYLSPFNSENFDKTLTTYNLDLDPLSLILLLLKKSVKNGPLKIHPRKPSSLDRGLMCDVPHDAIGGGYYYFLFVLWEPFQNLELFSLDRLERHSFVEAGDAMCRIMSFFRNIFGLYLSGFVIMIVSLDCYFAVVKPLGTHRANRRGRVMLVFAWIASFICSSPQRITHILRGISNASPSIPFHRRGLRCLNFFGFVFMYLLPLLTIIGCYSCILVEIYRINSTQRNGAELRRSNMGCFRQSKIKTLKMTVIIVTTFFLCWTPYNVMSLWYWFDKPSAQKVDQRIQKALFLFACTNSCVNPIIYGLFHFRKTETSTHASRNEGNTTEIPLPLEPNQCCVIENSESSRNTPAMTSSSSSKETNFSSCPFEEQGQA